MHNATVYVFACNLLSPYLFLGDSLADIINRCSLQDLMKRKTGCWVVVFLAWLFVLIKLFLRIKIWKWENNLLSFLLFVLLIGSRGEDLRVTYICSLVGVYSN